MFNEVFLAKKNDYQTIEDSCQYFFLKNETSFWIRHQSFDIKVLVEFVRKFFFLFSFEFEID